MLNLFQHLCRASYSGHPIRLYEIDFPLSVPIFELFFSGDSLFCSITHFKIRAIGKIVELFAPRFGHTDTNQQVPFGVRLAYPGAA
jgi:hypothetical protein